jgi:hypothetical protein
MAAALSTKCRIRLAFSSASPELTKPGLASALKKVANPWDVMEIRTQNVKDKAKV